jgi:hypothetical protein
MRVNGFDGLAPDQRVLMCQVACADPASAQITDLAVETFIGNGMTRERAIAVWICWLIDVRERIGVEGFGRA